MTENQKRRPKSPDPAKPGNTPTRIVSLRERWEEVRYGPRGRVLGYVLVFTLVFVAIFVFLLFLERGHF